MCGQFFLFYFFYFNSNFNKTPAGFVVGQAGLYQSITMFLVAYFIITMTVLSISAISTNGALDAGGAYCILSIPVIRIPSGREPGPYVPAETRSWST